MTGDEIESIRRQVLHLLDAVKAPLPAFSGAAHLPAKIANAGLWWERYGSSILSKESKPPFPLQFGADKKKSSDELARSVQSAKMFEDHDGHLRRYHDRFSRLAGPDAVCFEAVLRTPLAIGTGIPHPTENGLTFHPTFGVPYLPGSSLKGAAQAFADEWLSRQIYENAGERDEISALAARIFGQPRRLRGKDEFGEGETQLGSVIFFDALPLDWPVIKTEIMNPHVGDYLTAGKDLDENKGPRPIHFASVAPKTRFSFTLRPSHLARQSLYNDEWKADVNIAAGWLAACLRDVGVGAKTKAGYGRFDV